MVMPRGLGIRRRLRLALSLRVAALATLATLATAAVGQQAAPASSGSVAANPGRPTISTPATLTPVGYLQFENGVLGAWQSPEFTSQTGLNVTVKLAISDRIQFLAVTNPAATYKASGTLGTGSGDYALGGQAVVHAGHGADPTWAVSYLRRVYSGSAPDIDLGSPADSLLLLASADVHGFHYDANLFFDRMADHGVHRAQFGQTVAVSHPVTERLAISGELWHFTQPLLHGNATGTLWALGFTQRKNLVWDGGFDRGLTGTSTHWEAFAGFTYLLPHRLWR